MRVPVANSILRQMASNISFILVFSFSISSVYAQDDLTSNSVEDSVIAGHESITHSSEPAVDSMPATPISKYTCSLNGLVRRVEINYGPDNTSVPCDVNYYKDTETPNEVNTLWSAQNLSGYCEQKASEFVEKLQSWGWECSGS